jgi:protein-tyrosine-phosphatase
MLEQASLVLAMTPYQKATLNRLAGDPSGRIFTLREYASGVPDAAGIADPYTMPISSYRASVREISAYVDRIARKLQD